MTTHVGTSGKVKFATNAVAEMRTFEVTETIGTVDDTVSGDEWDTHLTLHKSWTGQVTVLWDETDTNGQAACTVGASGNFAFYPESDGSGATYMNGTATVISRQISSPYNGLVEMTLQVKGNGALTTTTV